MTAKKILEDVFKWLPKYTVILAGKAFLERDNFEDLPHFDVFVSGNPEALKNLEKLGYKTRYAPRTEGVGYSGTELRKALEWSR